MTTTTPSRVPLTKLFFGTSMQPQQHLCATAETIEPVVVVPPPPPPPVTQSPMGRSAPNEQPTVAAATSQVEQKRRKNHPTVKETTPPQDVSGNQQQLLTRWSAFVKRSCGWGVNRRVVSHMHPNPVAIKALLHDLGANVGSERVAEAMLQPTVDFVNCLSIMRQFLENVRNTYRWCLSIAQTSDVGEMLLQSQPTRTTASTDDHAFVRCFESSLAIYQSCKPFENFKTVLQSFVPAGAVRDQLLAEMDTEVTKLVCTIGGEGERMLQVYKMMLSLI